VPAIVVLLVGVTSDAVGAVVSVGGGGATVPLIARYAKAFGAFPAPALMPKDLPATFVTPRPPHGTPLTLQPGNGSAKFPVLPSAKGPAPGPIEPGPPAGPP